MKKIILLWLLSFTAFAQAPADKVPDVPYPAKAVVDYTGTLTQAQTDSLEKNLQQYYFRTTNQVVLVCVDDLKGYPVVDFAVGIGRKWKIGKKGKDNGIVFLWSKGDRKVGMAVGKGLESVITDGVSKSIVDDYVIPEFKQKNFYQGLAAGVEQIKETIAHRNDGFAEQRYVSNQKSKQASSGNGFGLFIVFLLFIGLCVFLYFWYQNYKEDKEREAEDARRAEEKRKKDEELRKLYASDPTVSNYKKMKQNEQPQKRIYVDPFESQRWASGSRTSSTPKPTTPKKEEEKPKPSSSSSSSSGTFYTPPSRSNDDDDSYRRSSSSSSSSSWDSDSSSSSSSSGYDYGGSDSGFSGGGSESSY